MKNAFLNVGKRITPYILVGPSIVVLLVMVCYPFFSNIYYSFLDFTLVKKAVPFVFFDNYLHVFQKDYFWSTLLRTFIWTISNIVLMLVLGTLTSLALNSGFKGKALLQSALLIPWILPEVVTGYTWKWMLTSEYGIVNNLLTFLGIINSDFSWFKTGTAAMAAVVLANVWRGYPFMTIMFYAKLKTLSKNQVEAAKIDGANGLQIFYNVTLAHLEPVIQKCTALAFIWTFNSFSIIFTMTNGGPIGKTETFPLIIQKTAFQNFKFSEASTMSIIMMLAMIAVLYSSSIATRIFGNKR